MSWLPHDVHCFVSPSNSLCGAWGASLLFVNSRNEFWWWLIFVDWKSTPHPMMIIFVLEIRLYNLFCNAYHHRRLDITSTNLQPYEHIFRKLMMTSSCGDIFRVTDPTWGVSTGDRWIPYKGQWRGVSILMCAWANGWTDNRDASVLRRHGTYCDVIKCGETPPWWHNMHHDIKFYLVNSLEGNVMLQFNFGSI